MNLINISFLIMPIMLLCVLAYAVYKKVNVYDVFIKGAKEGLEISINLFPYLLGMIVAINILLKSHFIDAILNILNPLFQMLKVPIEIIPMAIMRSISGSTTLALMNDIFTNHGVDSFLGRLASTIQGSTDTTIYILTLYFGSVGIKKIRYAMWAGLFADLMGVIASIVVVSLIFGN